MSLVQHSRFRTRLSPHSLTPWMLASQRWPVTTPCESHASRSGAPGHDIEMIVAWLEENGGFCDCEVSANSRDHWERNRL